MALDPQGEAFGLRAQQLEVDAPAIFRIEDVQALIAPLAAIGSAPQERTWTPLPGGLAPPYEIWLTARDLPISEGYAHSPAVEEKEVANERPAVHLRAAQRNVGRNSVLCVSLPGANRIHESAAVETGDTAFEELN